MARPQSKDKRQMILQTAIQLFAEEGLNAPTARIAKLTPVAEGTIFTYFSTKDELLNKLYLELKSQLRDALVPPLESADLQEQVWMAWQTYVNWGSRILKSTWSWRSWACRRESTRQPAQRAIELSAECRVC